MDINKLAILSNLLGGSDEVENVIDVPADLIQKAINGEHISSYEEAIIDSGYSKLEAQGLAVEYGIDIDEVNDLAVRLQTTIYTGFHDRDLENKFRELVSNDIVTTDDLENNWTLFPNLQTARIETIFGALTDNYEVDAKMIRDMFIGFQNDDRDIMSKDLKDSEFWAWFREMFYA